MNIEPYRSILTLLSEFQEKNGLEFRHLRYALIKNHDGIYYNIRDITKAFYTKGNVSKLDELIRNEEITPDCITSRYNLNNFLNRLIKIKVVKKIGRGKKPKYKIHPDFYKEVVRCRNIISIKSYVREEVVPIELSKTSDSSSTNKHVFYGIPLEIYNHNRVAINKLINEIEEKCKDIFYLCNKALWGNYEETYKRLLEESTNDFREFMKDKYDLYTSLCYGFHFGSYGTEDEKKNMVRFFGEEISLVDDNGKEQHLDVAKNFQYILERLDEYLSLFLFSRFNLSSEFAEKFVYETNKIIVSLVHYETQGKFSYSCYN